MKDGRLAKFLAELPNLIQRNLLEVICVSPVLGVKEYLVKDVGLTTFRMV